MTLEESVTRGTEVRLLRESNERYRSKLLELAQECAECDGTGLVTVRQSLEAEDAGRCSEAPQPCPQCADIREVLGQ